MPFGHRSTAAFGAITKNLYGEKDTMFGIAMSAILIYTASAITGLWGVAHLLATRGSAPCSGGAFRVRVAGLG